MERAPVNRLFFVCPTDHLEVPIRKQFMGEAFFCSALGVHFEFDIQMQFDLWDLIGENAIEQVIFVSAITNVFYKEAFENPESSGFSIIESLAQTRKKDSNHMKDLQHFFPNLHALAASHLAEQKERLLSSNYLGNLLASEHVAVGAYVYEPRKEAYYHLEEVKKKGEVLSNISFN